MESGWKCLKAFLHRLSMNLICASQKDVAGLNIARNLVEHFDFEKSGENEYSSKSAVLRIIEKNSIFADIPESDFDFIIFASRHSSAEGIHTFSIHTPGNFLDAQFGGKPGVICHSNPAAQKLALCEMKRLKEEMSLPYDVTMEATHHGPYTEKPTMFAEIGSGEEQWKDEKAGEVVACAIMKSLDYKNHAFPKAVGIGGGHYCQKHTDLMLFRDTAVGHVITKHVPLTLDRLLEARERNGGFDYFVFDWKGTPERGKVEKMLEEVGLPCKKAKELLK
jgi:D-aminoacyl-tRNA deacylase